MLRIDNSSQQNPSLWETVLPPELFQMKAIKGRTGQNDTALKNARDKLVKITEEVIAGGRAIQVELELPQEKLSLVNRLVGQLDGWD